MPNPDHVHASATTTGPTERPRRTGHSPQHLGAPRARSWAARGRTTSCRLTRGRYEFPGAHGHATSRARRREHANDDLAADLGPYRQLRTQGEAPAGGEAGGGGRGGGGPGGFGWGGSSSRKCRGRRRLGRRRLGWRQAGGRRLGRRQVGRRRLERLGRRWRRQRLGRRGRRLGRRRTGRRRTGRRRLG